MIRSCGIPYDPAGSEANLKYPLWLLGLLIFVLIIHFRGENANYINKVSTHEKIYRMDIICLMSVNILQGLSFLQNLCMIKMTDDTLRSFRLVRGGSNVSCGLLTLNRFYRKKRTDLF